MGFDVTRFIGEIDEEFICTICKMVLENPVHTPCDHLFCSECINNWVIIDKRCAVDRKPLSKIDLKPVSRTVRNLLNKLQMKCDFDLHGCNEIIKLEYVEGHRAGCEYNPDREIVCDKGCNLQMTRREYKSSNCLTHLAMNNKELTFEITNQNELINRQGKEITKLFNELRIHNEKIEKLTDEVYQLRRRQNQSTNISLDEPIWEMCVNIKTSFDATDHTYILETQNKSEYGCVRFMQALKPKNTSVKIQALNTRFFGVGLLVKGKSDNKMGNWLAIYMGLLGRLKSIGEPGVPQSEGLHCKVGDIIELGIKFPLNDGNDTAEVYLSANDQVLAESLVKIPNNAIYASIFVGCKLTKVKYFGTGNVDGL